MNYGSCKLRFSGSMSVIEFHTDSSTWRLYEQIGVQPLVQSLSPLLFFKFTIYQLEFNVLRYQLK